MSRLYLTLGIQFIMKPILYLQIAIISLHNIHRLILLKEAQCGLFLVRCEPNLCSICNK